MDMLRLAPEGVLESHRDIAKSTLQPWGRIPGSWKREIMFPIGKAEGTETIEKHWPVMLIEARRGACTGIIIKRIRKVWDANNATSLCNFGFARGVSTVEPIMKLRMSIDQATPERQAPLLKRGGPE